MIEASIIVHGGAGTISEERKLQKFPVLKEVARAGYQVLMETGNVLDAVELAVKMMEDHETFNAGYGSVLTLDGDVEMDALIIRGADLSAGGVGGVKHIKNPICLARKVMENTSHSLMASIGAEEFAKSQGIEIVSSESLISPSARDLRRRILEKKSAPTTETESSDKGPKSGGTVGAVAINQKGEIAAATSTGGIACKLSGRVGDTPIIGAGTFCDDNICGISATGLGEAIMKSCLSARIAFYMEQGVSMDDACEKSLTYMKDKIPNSSAGVIVIKNNGDVGFSFNSKQLAWTYVKNNKLHYGCDKGEHFIEEN